MPWLPPLKRSRRSKVGRRSRSARLCFYEMHERKLRTNVMRLVHFPLRTLT